MMDSLIFLIIIMLPLLIAAEGCGWWRTRVDHNGMIYWRRKDGTFANNFGCPVRDENLIAALRATLPPSQSNLPS
jgi:hypothetical protein